MSRAERVADRNIHNFSTLRRWRSNACVLIPKADRCKDWKDKVMTVYFLLKVKLEVKPLLVSCACQLLCV